MLSGFKGLQYGLQTSKARAKAGLPLCKPLAAFGGDEGDEDPQTVGQAIERQAAKKRADVKVNRMHAAALAEDPSAFDYDGVYDSIQEQRVQPKLAEKHARKSRYIESLLDKAKERDREQDIVYERKLLRERQVEDHLFGDKEKYVTAAYRKKLEEDRKWLEEEKKREEAEAADDVRKKGHLGDFYRNLLGNNVAFGTAKAPEENKGLSAEPSSEAPQKPADAAWEAARKAREDAETRNTSNDAASAQLPGDAPQLSADAAAGPAGKGGEGNKGEEGNSGEGEEKEAPPPQKTEEEKRLERESRAAAAKERYLARKRKAPPE